MRNSLWLLRRVVCTVRGHDFEPSGWCARRCGATTEPTREVKSWWFAPLPDGGTVTMIRYTDGTEERHEEPPPPGYAVPEAKPLRAEDGWQDVGYTEDHDGGRVFIAPAGTPLPLHRPCACGNHDRGISHGVARPYDPHICPTFGPITRGTP